MAPSNLGQEGRSRARQTLTTTTFDIVVIGSGITGAAVAREAVLRGYRVALVDKGDFASGTSSRSSRLIHGGLRYLEQGELSLVMESLHERAQLARLARHIVRPLPFLFPVYKNHRWPLFAVDLGLWAYDALALFRNYRTHRRLHANELSARAPGLRSDGLSGGVLYYDFQTNDARLVLENVICAAQRGASVLSYCEAERFNYRGPRVESILARDRITGEKLCIRGHLFVCAAGPWTDTVLSKTTKPTAWMRPTKGVHIVLRSGRLPVEAAVLLQHPEDGRVFFVLPDRFSTVVGTTDTDFTRDPDAANADSHDMNYLLRGLNHFFPDAQIRDEDINANWTGIRPLLSDSSADTPSAVSREHRIDVRDDGITVVAGGKLTTYRCMASECLDETLRARHIGTVPTATDSDNRNLPLPGAVGLDKDSDLEVLARQLAQTFTAGHGVADHLARTYGVRAHMLADLATRRPELKTPVVDGLPFVWAEIPFAARHDLATTLSDILVRRTDIFYRASDQGTGLAARAAELAAPELGWDTATAHTQTADFKSLVEENRAWRNDTKVALPTGDKPAR